MNENPYPKEFEKILEGDRPEGAASIVARSVLRALPASVQIGPEAEHDFLLTLRFALMALVSSVSQKNTIDLKINFRSIKRLQDFDNPPYPYGFMVSDSSRALFNLVIFLSAEPNYQLLKSAAHASGNTLDSIDAASDAFRLNSKLILRDIQTMQSGEAVFDTELYPTGDRQQNYDMYLAAFLERLRSRKNYEFWVAWFTGLLSGEPIDWELQSRVALIDEEIWDAGSSAVATEIARIEAEHLAEKAPQAERIEFNEETSKFFAVPIDVAKPDLLGATLSQVQDALEDVLANPGNGISERSREARVLQRVFSKYGNDPQQIEMGFVTVHKGLTRQIVVGDDLPASEENLALMDALEEGAKAVRAMHPEVAENRKIINDQALKELSPEDLVLLEDAQPLLAERSEPELADDWNTDIPKLINDATLPLPTGAPPLPGMDETQRIFSRAAKIQLKYKVFVKSGAKIFDGDTMKTVRLGLTWGSMLSALVGLGLKIFGLI